METFTTQQARQLLDTLADWTPGLDVESDLAALGAVADLHDLVKHRLTAEVVTDLRSLTAQGFYAEVTPGDAWTRRPPKVRLRKRTAADRSNHRWTWDAIGGVLGMSKQAARQRFQ